jgi:hypothetical protein
MGSELSRTAEHSHAGGHVRIGGERRDSAPDAERRLGLEEVLVL